MPSSQVEVSVANHIQSSGTQPVHGTTAKVANVIPKHRFDFRSQSAQGTADL